MEDLWTIWAGLGFPPSSLRRNISSPFMDMCGLLDIMSLEIDLLANLLQKDNSHLPHSLIMLCLGVSSCQGKDTRMIKMLSSSPKS